MRKPVGYLSSSLAVRKQHAPRGLVRWLENNLEFFIPGAADIMVAYDEDDDYYYIPRGAMSFEGFPELPHGISDQRIERVVDIPDSKIKLRGYQIMPVKKLRKAGGGVLHAVTGSGKTTMYVHLIGLMKQKTLIIVHTKDLQDQWYERILEGLGYEAGFIGQGVWQEKLITIATVQTLARYDFNKSDFTQQFGMVVCDEVHHAPASTFAKVLSAMSARYIYGATATPTRADHMHPLMHAIIGPVVATVKAKGLIRKGSLVKPTAHMVSTGFTSSLGIALAETSNPHAKRTLYAKLVKKLVKDDKRNALIVKCILKHKDESVLVLSERIDHLEILHDLVLAEDWTVNSRVVTGSTPKPEREDSLNAMRDGTVNVMFASTIADEGLDLPRLNVLILTFPSKAVQRLTQRIGRIMRSHTGKTAARVYDFADVDIPVFRGHAITRRNLYRQSKMITKGWAPGKDAAAPVSVKKKWKPK